MWLSLAIVAFTFAAAVDYHWLRTFVVAALLPQPGPPGGDAGHRQRRRWRVALGDASSAPVPVLGGRQDPDGRRAGQLDRLARPRSPDSFWTLVGAGVVAGPPLVLVLIQPDLGTSLVFGAIGFGALFVAGANLRWMVAAVVAVVVPAAAHLDGRPQGLPEAAPAGLPGPGSRPARSRATSCSSRRSRWAPAALFGKGLTQRQHRPADYLPVSATDFVFATLGEELGFVGGCVVLLSVRAAASGA